MTAFRTYVQQGVSVLPYVAMTPKPEPPQPWWAGHEDHQPVYWEDCPSLLTMNFQCSCGTNFQAGYSEIYEAQNTSRGWGKLEDLYKTLSRLEALK